MGRIYRKLQKIGGSLVISLPKKWTENYQLNAGSSIGIELRNDGSLSIIPTMEEEVEKIKDENVLIADELVIWELLKKIFGGETKITIRSEKKISKILSKSIRQYVNRLPNTEIIEETNQEMIVQNFGYKEIPTKKLIQRLLYLAANIFEDLEQKSFDDLEDNFKQLKRFYFILVIHIRTYLRTGIYISSTSEFTPLKAMDYRMFSEKIVELAEMLRELRLIENVLDYYKEIQQYFNEVMNAFLQKDDKLAFNVWMKKDFLFKSADDLLNNNDYVDKENVKKLMKIAQKIKDMSALI
jgi:antitoxin component of MazEF toxin-antitoxin module